MVRSGVCRRLNGVYAVHGTIPEDCSGVSELVHGKAQHFDTEAAARQAQMNIDGRVKSNTQQTVY